MCATIVLNQYTLLWIEQLIEDSLTVLEYYAISILRSCYFVLGVIVLHSVISLAQCLT